MQQRIAHLLGSIILQVLQNLVKVALVSPSLLARRLVLFAVGIDS
jgi:hypothetical protein